MLMPAFGGRVVPTRPLGPLAFLTLIVLLTIIVSSALIPSTIVQRSMPLPAAPALNQLPLAFVPNAGQTDPAVRFQAQAPGSSLFFTAADVVLALATSSQPGSDPGVLGPFLDQLRVAPTLPAPIVVRLQFVGADPRPQLVGSEPLPGIVNYLRGNDPARWRAGLPTYAGLSYQQLYPGIDLHYAGQGGQLKGTYVVAPGADPGRIRWRYAGARTVTINDQTGALDIALAGDGVPPLHEDAPTAWQEYDGQRHAITVHYRLVGNGQVRFALGDYDRSRPLVLDPLLSYSTYLGGSAGEHGNSIAVDGAGQAYVTGTTTSTNFLTAHAFDASLGGGQDAFVSKLDARGTTLLYSTFLGGSRFDDGHAIAVDQAGNAYVTGTTSSADFPTVNALDANYGGRSDAFVSMLDARGARLRYSTFLGGSATDVGTSIAVDGAGQAYITGWTSSTNFPTSHAFDASVNGDTDAFVSTLDAQGSTLRYSTYLGGSASDSSYGITVDQDGQAYVTGYTGSADFPTINALDASLADYDAFVSTLDVRGSTLRYSTFLGGSAGDFGLDVGLDDRGQAYIIGTTWSADFPTVNALDATLGGDRDAFVSTLDVRGASLRYSTFLGGSMYEDGTSIAVDTVGNAYVTGVTVSPDFPTAQPIDATVDFRDAFVTKIGTSPLSRPQPLDALSSTNAVLHFASDAPEHILHRTPVTGLPADEKLLGIEVRPATGQLYALGSTSRLYRIDPAVGRAIAVGAAPFTPALDGHVFGLDVDPTTDKLHVVSDTGQHLRLDLDTGTVRGIEPRLRYAAGDPNAGRPLGLDGAAFTSGTNPRFYVLDSANDVLAVLRDGALHTIGPLGVGVEPLVGFDIVPTGEAIAALRADDGISGAVLVTINLDTGQLTSLGRIGPGERLRGLTIAVPR